MTIYIYTVKKPTITFTFEKVMLNSVDGWLATKRTDGVFCGTLFGKTKKDAMRAFEQREKS